MKNPLVTRAHFYTPLTGVCALCGADSPDSQMSGLFCVTSFRTRECLPCAAVQLSQRTLRLAQFADANSATHNVLIMYHDRLPIFGRRSFYIPTSNQGGHSLWQNRKPSPNCKLRSLTTNANSSSSNANSSNLKIVSPTTKRVIAASGRTGSSPVVQPSRALLRRRKSWAKPSFTLLPKRLDIHSRRRRLLPAPGKARPGVPKKSTVVTTIGGVIAAVCILLPIL